MKPSSSLALLVLAAAAFPTPARGADTPALPAGELGLMPAYEKRPQAVGARERVDGIFVAAGGKEHTRYSMPGLRHTGVFSSAAAARDFSAGGAGLVRSLAAAARGKPLGLGREPARGCFTLGHIGPHESDPRPWPSMLQERLMLSAVEPGSLAGRLRAYEPTRVQVVRHERLALAGEGRATLEAVDAWIDPLTSGARLIRRSTLPLARVGSGPRGLEIYAARATAGGAVHFVVHGPLLPDEERPFAGVGLSGSRGTDGLHSDCDHLTITLRVAPGGGESANVRVEIPRIVEAAAEAARPEPRGGVSPFAALARVALGGMAHAELAEERPLRELAVRTLAVHLSASQTSADAEPVVAVSMGWRGRERRMQIP
jgi:hypothetical protein